MKLPMDLTNDMSQYEELATKMYCMTFLITMLANFLPSLGLMDDRELLTNMVALGIHMITIVVNIGIQFDASTIVPEVATLIFPTLWPFSVAITVSATRKKLEREYKELQPFVSCHEDKMFSFKEHKRNVKKCWMMVETRNPQFVIACSPVSSEFGVLCSIFACQRISTFSLSFYTVSDHPHIHFANSDYKWSLKYIVLVQSFGVVVGSSTNF
uniref:Uncharacterized protein n=2 Tax=Helianthus annuus TaxID=4232 RepID=A0A251TFI5_HELAN